MADATRRKTIHVHIGPHKTGSTAIQHVLREHAAEITAACGATPILDASVRQASQAILREAAADIPGALADLAAQCSKVRGDCLISSEDFSGDLPGRAGKRRIYPRLWRNLNLLRGAFPDWDVRFYFFRRDPEVWLRSVYVQILKYRTKFRSLESYKAFLTGIDGLWDGPLKRSRNRLGPDFIEIPYEERAGFSAVTALLDAIAGRPDAVRLPAETPRRNVAPPEVVVRLMEDINGSGASAEAKRNAKAALLGGAPGPSLIADMPAPPAQTAAGKRPDWLSAELSGLWSRVERRTARQDQPNLMPDSGADLAPFRTRIVTASDAFPEGGRQQMQNQLRILAYRFGGMPETCLLLGLAISYLRRDTEHTAHASGLFQRLWEEEHALLLGLLPTRWLISSFQTFMDHGTTEAQRLIGAGAFFHANTLKLYETERALDGLAPDATYRHAVPATKNGFSGLDRFRLGGSDLALNTNALLLELAAGNAVAGRVVQEYMLRLKVAHSAFSRMDRSRIAHGVDIPQFSDCWSFADKPRDA